MNIEASPRKVFTLLLSVIGFLVFAHLTGVVMTHVFDHPWVYGLVPLFDLDTEGNIPTLYSSLQLVLASFILTIIGTHFKSNGEVYVFWLALAVIFLFLSIDETAELHERLVSPIRNAYALSGILYYSWIIPYGIALLAIVAVFSRFLLKLPKKTMLLFVASGAIYVSGAIGFEMLDGLSSTTLEVNALVKSIIITFEETLELVGIALFIYSLLAYISEEHQQLQYTIKY